MILKSRQPKKFEKDKYYVDMNELQNKSRSRLYYVFGHIVQKELDWSDEQTYTTLQEFGRRVEFDALIKAMNEHIKDLVVFYYGKGDNVTQYVHDAPPNKGTPKKKIERKPRRKKKQQTVEEIVSNEPTKKTTQEIFEEKMREQVRLDDERIANSKRKWKKVKK